MRFSTRWQPTFRLYPWYYTSFREKLQSLIRIEHENQLRRAGHLAAHLRRAAADARQRTRAVTVTAEIQTLAVHLFHRHAATLGLLLFGGGRAFKIRACIAAFIRAGLLCRNLDCLSEYRASANDDGKQQKTSCHFPCFHVFFLLFLPLACKSRLTLNSGGGKTDANTKNRCGQAPFARPKTTGGVRKRRGLAVRCRCGHDKGTSLWNFAMKSARS